VNKIKEGIGDKVANCLQWAATCVSGLIFGLVYGWQLALVVIAISPLLVISGGLMTYVSKFYGLFGCNNSFYIFITFRLSIINYFTCFFQFNFCFCL